MKQAINRSYSRITRPAQKVQYFWNPQQFLALNRHRLVSKGGHGQQFDKHVEIIGPLLHLIINTAGE